MSFYSQNIWASVRRFKGKILKNEPILIGTNNLVLGEWLQLMEDAFQGKATLKQDIKNVLGLPMRTSNQSIANKDHPTARFDSQCKLNLGHNSSLFTNVNHPPDPPKTLTFWSQDFVEISAPYKK